MNECVYPKRGAADEDRQCAARGDLADRMRRVLFEIYHRVGALRMRDINKTMGNAAHFTLGNFCGAYIKPAIHLSRIRRDYFTVIFFCKAQSKFGFTGRGGADEYN